MNPAMPAMMTPNTHSDATYTFWGQKQKAPALATVEQPLLTSFSFLLFSHHQLTMPTLRTRKQTWVKADLYLVNRYCKEMSEEEKERRCRDWVDGQAAPLIVAGLTLPAEPASGDLDELELVSVDISEDGTLQRRLPNGELVPENEEFFPFQFFENWPEVSG